MATLEQVTKGAAVRGILPDGIVTVSDVHWIGTVAIETPKATNVTFDLDQLLALNKEPA